MYNKSILFILFFVVAVIALGACVHPPRVIPETKRTNVPGVCFERDILPIFISNCAKSGCHDAGSAEDGYVLDNYNNIMRKGIVPGNAAASKIYESITESDERMPKDAPPLSAAQLELIKQWIMAGAVDSGACSNTCDTANYTYSGTIAPMMRLYCTGCHNSAMAPGGGLTDHTSVMNAAVYGRLIGNISHTPGYNVMPPSGVQLSACEITQLKKWVAAGAPNN